MARHAKHTLSGAPTVGMVEKINEQFEDLYRRLAALSGHALVSLTHSDTLIDGEAPDVVRGDLLVGQTTPQGADHIKWQRFALGAAHTVLKTTLGVDPIWAQVDLVDDVTNVLRVVNGGTNKSSYTAGSVVFAGASGTTLTEDNANLFWDDTNNRLGLGVAAPTVRLDIVNAGLTTTVTDTVRLANTTAATSGVTRQFSPVLVFSGTGWDVDGAASRTVRAGIYARTLSANIPESFLVLAFDEGTGAGFIDEIYLGRAVDGGAPDLRFRDGNILFRNNGARGIGFTANPLTDTMSSQQVMLGYSDNTIEFVTVGSYVRLLGNTQNQGVGVSPMMDIRAFDAGTTTPVISIRHRATPGGTAGVGFGTRQLSQAKSSTTADMDQSAIDTIWAVATHATRSADVVVSLVDNAAALAEKFRLRSTGLLTFGGITNATVALKPSGTTLETKLADDSAYAQHKALEYVSNRANFLMRSTVAWTNGAGASLGTLTNAPAAGDPTKWIAVDDNGTTRYIPAW